MPTFEDRSVAAAAAADLDFGERQSAALRVYVMNDEVPIDELGERTFEAVKVNSPQIANDDFEMHGSAHLYPRRRRQRPIATSCG